MHSLTGPRSRGLQAVVHDWITLGALGLAWPASKAVEVEKAGPAQVFCSGMPRTDLTDRVFEES